MKRGLLALGAAVVLLTGFAHAQPAPAAVRTQTVKRADFTPIVAATGTVEPIGVIEVGPQVAGTIVRFAPHSESRDAVDAGQLLAELDDSFLKVRAQQEQAHLARAAAELKQAKAKVDPARSDPAGASVAQAAVEVAQAAVAEAQASAAEAKLNLEATRITSPVKGTILLRGGEVGQAVGPNPNGSGMFLIWASGNRTQVWANVSETDVAAVQVGRSVQFTCPGLPGRSFSGKVARVRLQAARVGQGVQYTVEIDTDNSDGALLPYLTAEARIDAEPRHNALLVPNAALEWLPQSELLASMRRQAAGGAAGGAAADPAVKGRRVWVLSDNTAKPIPVQLGRSDGRQTEVTGGNLKEGDAVVIEGSLP